MKQVYILVLLLVVVGESYSQIARTNFDGIKSYWLLFSYKDVEEFKDILPDEDDVKSEIEYKTGLMEASKESVEEGKSKSSDERIIIQLIYGIYRNWNEINFEQYYGMYSIKVQRVLYLPNSNNICNPNPTIHDGGIMFIINNPVKKEMKKEIKQYITNLINEFALDYKNSY